MKERITEKLLKETKLPNSGRVRIWDTETTGFMALVGKTGTTFYASVRVGQKMETEKIGKHLQPGPDGKPWNVTRARKEAVAVVARLLSGEPPKAKAKKAAKAEKKSKGGITLREGLKLHVANMEEDNRSKRSIDTLKNGVELHLKDYLDTPLADITVDDLDKVKKKILKNTPKRAGSVNPPGKATANRIITNFGTIWNAVDRRHQKALTDRNPAERLKKGRLKPQEARVSEDEFEGWISKVATLSPVRRDLQLLALFTGIRSDGLRHITWDAVDFKKQLLHVRKAKGDKPYTIPLSVQQIKILKRRKKENPKLFKDYGGDHGWVFPSLTRAQPYEVIPVAEPKEYRVTKEGERYKFLPNLHQLRRTYNSVAIEIGVSPHLRETLMNHEDKGVNLEHYGQPENWDFIATIQQKISLAIVERLGKSPPVEL